MPLKPHPTDPDKMVYVNRQYNFGPQPGMHYGPRLFGGREVILGPVGEKKRLGWVYKDTGLPPTEEETNAVLAQEQRK